MKNIENKWILLTGASRGVGIRVVRALASYKPHFILQSRTLDGTKELVKELQTQGLQAYGVAAELSDIKQVEAMIAEAKKISGDHIDILYNNAAIMTKYMHNEFSTPAEDYTQSFLVNATVPAIICNAFIPQMIKRGWGRVVNVTSGIANEPQLMAYSCSKAALDRYVRDLVPTLKGTGVLMNLLDPGWLRTDLGGDQAPNDADMCIPGALVPILLDEEAGSGKLYAALDYAKNK